MEQIDRWNPAETWIPGEYNIIHTTLATMNNKRENRVLKVIES